MECKEFGVGPMLVSVLDEYSSIKGLISFDSYEIVWLKNFVGWLGNNYSSENADVVIRLKSYLSVLDSFFLLLSTKSGEGQFQFLDNEEVAVPSGAIGFGQSIEGEKKYNSCEEGDYNINGCGHQFILARDLFSKKIEDQSGSSWFSLNAHGFSEATCLVFMRIDLYFQELKHAVFLHDSCSNINQSQVLSSYQNKYFLDLPSKILQLSYNCLQAYKSQKLVALWGYSKECAELDNFYLNQDNIRHLSEYGLLIKVLGNGNHINLSLVVNDGHEKNLSGGVVSMAIQCLQILIGDDENKVLNLRHMMSSLLAKALRPSDRVGLFGDRDYHGFTASTRKCFHPLFVYLAKNASRPVDDILNQI